MRFVFNIVLITCLVAIALPAFAGDDDKPPPYMIYIDPETGRYMTDDPATAHPGATVDSALAAGGSGQKSAHFPAVSIQTISLASVLLLILWAGIKWLAQRRTA